MLRNGREYQGTLVESNAEEVRFRVEGEVQAYPRAEVVHIRLQKRRRWADAESAADLDDTVLQEALKVDAEAVRQTGAGALTLHHSTQVRLETPHTWTVKRRAVVRILNESGEDESIQQMTFHRDGEEARILYGISVRPNGEVIHLRDTAVQIESPYHEFARYNTLTSWRFALPEGKPGITLDYAYRIDRRKPVHDLPFSAEYRLGGVDPMRDIAVTVTTPANVPIRWQVLNDDRASVTHERSDGEDGAVTHTWHRKSAPRLFIEPRMPPLGDIVPRLIITAETDTWKARARRAEDRITTALQKQNLPPIPDGVDTTPEALWSFISRTVSKNPVSVEATGFTPGSLAQTLSLRQGAPLDRNALLFAWLREHLDAPVHWCWIRPRTRGALGIEAPRLDGFNTPAVAVGEGEQRRILVLGDDLAAFGEPAAELAGATGLVAGEGLFALPRPEPAWRGTDRRVKVELDEDGTGTVVDQLTCRGPAARRFRQWRRMTEEQIHNRVQAQIRDQLPAAAGISWTTDDDWTRNDPAFAITFTYRVPGLAHVHENVASLKVPWLEYQASLVGRRIRQHPLFWNAPVRHTVAVDVGAPAGMQWQFVPEAAQLEVAPPEPNAQQQGITRLTTTRKLDAARGSYDLDYERRAILLPSAQYRDLKQCLESRARIGQKYWIARP